jgi:hypothetical protein
MGAKARPPRQPPPAKRRGRAREAKPAAVLGPPQRTPATVASPRHKSYRNTAPPRTEGRQQGPGQETLRPHRNSTARQRQRHPRANRTYRRNAPRRDTQTAADRTRSDSKRTPKRPDRRRQRTAQTNRQGHGEPHQRAPGHAPGHRHGGHPPQQNQRQRHRTHRTRDRRKNASARDNAARRQSPHHNATAQHAQQTAENRGARGQQTEATSDTNTTAPPKAPKHQHVEKPKNKSKKDGSWRQTVEREKVASSETTVRARSTRTTTEEAR